MPLAVRVGLSHSLVESADTMKLLSTTLPSGPRTSSDVYAGKPWDLAPSEMRRPSWAEK
ncbi:hypothetical protein [Streptomyces sp. NBC_01363]|uniref:hypothetical protein n=1 Tax=Streptomyces sp. NBC_01363 TaxID=2903840 RepID=UPI00338DA7AD